MRKILSLVCVAVLSACAGGGSAMQSQLPPGAASATRSIGTDSVAQALTPSKNWDIGTGASNNYYAYQDLDFLPANITIDAGDTITYHVGSGVGGDAHTVAFVPPGMKVPSPGDPLDLAPYGGTTVDGTKPLNSGILVGGQTFTLHFPKAGTYRILCLFHEPAMVMTVVVQNAGAPYPHTAQYYLNTGAIDEWQDFYEAAQSVALFPFPNGGKTFAAGIDPGLVHFPPPDSTVLRYINTDDRTKIPAEGSITIKVGTVLTWVNETSNEPHTVTFALAGQSSVPNIPPDPAVNVSAPPNITTYDGSHTVNSGTLIGGRRFQLKFTKAGKYFYGCLYHDNSRMTGWVTVTP